MKTASLAAVVREYGEIRPDGGKRRLRHWWNTGLRPISQTLRIWRQRARSRADLAALDDRMLRDIGISRVDARREADKPFWRQ